MESTWQERSMLLARYSHAAQDWNSCIHEYLFSRTLEVMYTHVLSISYSRIFVTCLCIYILSGCVGLCGCKTVSLILNDMP